MTFPAQNFAIGKPVAASLALMVCLPSTTACSASIGKHKSLGASPIRMIVSLSSTLTFPIGIGPSFPDRFIGERHVFSPPFLDGRAQLSLLVLAFPFDVPLPTAHIAGGKVIDAARQ
jgi:hypothetical protein